MHFDVPGIGSFIYYYYHGMVMKNIVVFDSDPIMADYYREALEAAGYTGRNGFSIVAATRSADAIASCLENDTAMFIGGTDGTNTAEVLRAVRGAELSLGIRKTPFVIMDDGFTSPEGYGGTVRSWLCTKGEYIPGGSIGVDFGDIAGRYLGEPVAEAAAYRNDAFMAATRGNDALGGPMLGIHPAAGLYLMNEGRRDASAAQQ